MKIKIKYDVKDIEGVNKKSYAKTFNQINQTAQNVDFKNFTEAYLSLVNNNGHEIGYTIYKASEEEILAGELK